MTSESTPNEVNIGDILRLALPLKTTVVAGARHARRNVHWVVPLTNWDNLATQVRASDLVFVPPAVRDQITEDELLQHLETFAELSVTSLLFFQEVSDKVSKKADSFGIPLLVAPPTITVREAHRAITTLLVDRLAATTERGMQLYRKLSEMSREGKGLSAMTEVMSKLTGNIVVVQDKRLEIRALSSPRDRYTDLTELCEVLMHREQLPAILRNRKAAAKARQSYWQQLLPIQNMGRLISPIVSGDRARGYVSVVGPADQLDMLDSLTAEHGAAACALEMAKAKAVSEAKKELRGNFLEGLLAGTLPQKEIERLEGRLDHDTRPPHAVMTFTWVGSDTPSLRRLETTLNWLLSNHSRAALVHIYGDKHVCVFQVLKDTEDMPSAHELSRRLLEQVEAEYPGARLIGGISGPAPELSAWPRVYREALQAMELGQRLKLSQVVEFDSLGIYQLLGQLEDIPAVKAFTEQVIGPLAEYDRQHQSTMMQTIDAYFQHHGNISQTAESLFIHRNTLLYRLERIQELTGHDLNQANVRLALHLTLKLWQLRPDT